MLNFTGQSRRRNINLGNRTVTSKQDLLAKAQLEREKRAQNRQREQAAIVLQCYIRRHQAIKMLFTDLLPSIPKEKVKHIIPAFGCLLHTFLTKESTLEIIKHSSSLTTYPGTLGNLQIFSLISSYDDASIMVETLKCINLKKETKEAFLNALKSFLKKTRSLEEESARALLHVMMVWKLNSSEIITPLFEINASEALYPKIVLDFYQFLASEGIFPKPNKNSSSLLENLSYIYFNTPEKQKGLEHCIASCFRNLHYTPVNRDLEAYVTELYETSFIDKIAGMIEDPNSYDIDMENVIGYIEGAADDNSKNSMLIALLSRSSFLRQSYIAFKQHNNVWTSEDQSRASFILFTRLLQMHLLVSTDHELLSGSSGFTDQDLTEFTTDLKHFVFSNIWEPTSESKTNMADAALPLLQKLYLRDSRLHFCSTKNDPQFWCNKNPEFLRVSPFKYIEDYERLYREYADRREDMFSEADDDTGVDDLGSMKYEILNHLSLSYKNSVSTRQFKKLEILIKAPFFIPFEQRVNLFYMFIAIDKQRLNLSDDSQMMALLMPWNLGAHSRQSATISREHVLEDACNAFNGIGERFKSKLAVTFVNEFGPEAGIDGGGITKEFLTSVSDEGFKGDKYHLFDTNDQHELYPSTEFDSQKLTYMWFMGKIVGKCLYDHVLIDVTFADFFLKKILNYSSKFISSFDDLYSLDVSLYSNLVKLLSMSSEQIEALDLSFEINSNKNDSQVVQLIPNGSNIKVSKSNVLLYIFKVADFKLNRSLNKQIRNFHGGMSMVIAPHWMEMFNSVELQMLISGGGKDIDLKDLRDNTEYGGYLDTDKSIQAFWEILKEFSPEERLNFIKFVTSVPRAPLQGFGSLEPKFGIRNAGGELDRLPTASTCVNLLKLPDYQNKELLRRKLLYAINSGARFDLS
ncbi:hypothetical protein HG535_0D01530 [Zygotorulaspora mrakii]|uniref:HECT-type E3 ubiquitin transferase n=1 Tax=Zygotorulaspora mrakii TaxID=42260 RepID=A0A7H9B1A0_ZYGMR|nr:uncharacterized protein HG535_0D01530 [Zygotorulaspora mrakii]QLG72445.1 hypothetical protein HG535_0D01530 [Zygotorulaspora mrakii]